MKEVIQRFEAELTRRLDADGNGKVDLADVHKAIAGARDFSLRVAGDVERGMHQVDAHPRMSSAIALLVGATLGGVVGIVIGVTTIAPHLH